MNSVKLETQACPLGCPQGDEAVLTGRDLLHNLPGEFAIAKCRSCGLMRTNPRPVRESIGLYYPEDYAPYVGTQVRERKPASRVRKLSKRAVQQVFNFTNVKMPPNSHGRLLEVGCASGAFLHEMARQGWQVEGIEFSQKAAEAAAKQGYRIHAGPLESAPSPSKPFDVIIGWMVLEHLYDPIDGLRRLRQWAKPGAQLILSVPNCGSLEFRLFRENWYGLHLPNHLHHFTPETLSKVLMAGGWHPERICHQRLLTNLIASAGYALQARRDSALARRLISFPKRAGYWHYILYPLAYLLAVFGQTGRMTVIARPAGPES